MNVEHNWSLMFNFNSIESIDLQKIKGHQKWYLEQRFFFLLDILTLTIIVVNCARLTCIMILNKSVI